jgi:hypothetical protein
MVVVVVGGSVVAVVVVGPDGGTDRPVALEWPDDTASPMTTANRPARSTPTAKPATDWRVRSFAVGCCCGTGSGEASSTRALSPPHATHTGSFAVLMVEHVEQAHVEGVCLTP